MDVGRLWENEWGVGGGNNIALKAKTNTWGVPECAGPVSNNHAFCVVGVRVLSVTW